MRQIFMLIQQNMQIVAQILVAVLLAVPSSSLFTWKRTLLLPESDFSPETAQLCKLFDEQEGVRNISKLSHQDQTLNLTFVNSVRRDPNKIVNLYLTFPPYMLAASEKSLSLECIVQNSSLVLVVIEQRGGSSRLVTYESKLDYSFRYLPFTSLKMASKEISLEITFTQTTFEQFLGRAAVPQYLSLLPSILLSVILFKSFLSSLVEGSKCNEKFMEGAVLMLVALKLRILIIISLASVKDFMFVVFEAIIEIVFLSAALFMYCICLAFTKQEKYMIAYGVVALFLVCWFNSATLVVFAIFNVAVVFAKNRILGKIQQNSKTKTIFIILLMLYMILFKVSSEINPGEYPYSFQPIEMYSPEITNLMLFLLMLNGLLLFDCTRDVLLKVAERGSQMIKRKNTNVKSEVELAEDIDHPAHRG